MDQLPKRIALRSNIRLEQDPLPPNQEGYEFILQDLADIRISKARSYGETQYNGEDFDEDMIERMLECKRKFNRMRSLTKIVRKEYHEDGRSFLNHGGTQAWKDLQDAYRDLANYSIMALQVMEVYGQKEPLDLA